MEKTMDKIVALAKARGFIYPGSEIYGGLANTWDYGNLGVELKNNVKQAWWKKFIRENPYNVGIDCAILMNPQTWVASGHLGSFSDPLMDCKECHERFRADKVIEDYMADNGIAIEGSVDAWSNEQMENYIKEKEICCPSCGKKNFTEIRQFNLMFKTFQGVTEDAKNTVYLRPETAQGIFVNFKNVQRTSRKKIPFGIGQIGKSFRNEITPGNFTFRTREFEQMELEFFCEPDTDLEWFAYWKEFCINWLKSLGMKEEEMRVRDHEKEELSFYSKATTDIEFLFPFGWGELWGIADRTDYDLTQHQEHSGKSLEYINRVRRRCGLPDFEDSWALAGGIPSGQKLRKVLHQERSIEFLFEGRRFHDLRRWKEAPEVMNKQPRSWNRDAKTQDDFYQVIQAAQGGRVRVFESPKSYWLAIPLNQINKNPQLVQNPGY